MSKPDSSAKFFLDEALNRLIDKGIVTNSKGRLSFTKDWTDFLTRSLSYGMDKHRLKEQVVRSLQDFYHIKGYEGDIRFDLSWIKQIFLAQFSTLDNEQRRLIKEFIEGIELLDA
jgi:hypothetical protein